MFVCSGLAKSDINLKTYLVISYSMKSINLSDFARNLGFWFRRSLQLYNDHDDDDAGICDGDHDTDDDMDTMIVMAL